MVVWDPSTGLHRVGEQGRPFVGLPSRLLGAVRPAGRRALRRTVAVARRPLEVAA